MTIFFQCVLSKCENKLNTIALPSHCRLFQLFSAFAQCFYCDTVKYWYTSDTVVAYIFELHLNTLAINIGNLKIALRW